MPIHLLYAIFGGLVGMGSIVRTVPVGRVGVRSMFGAIREIPLKPGLHLTNPFVKVDIINVQSQTINYMNLPTLTSEGLTVEVDVAVTFRVNTTYAVKLYSTVGRDWQVSGSETQLTD